MADGLKLTGANTRLVTVKQQREEYARQRTPIFRQGYKDGEDVWHIIMAKQPEAERQDAIDDYVRGLRLALLESLDDSLEEQEQCQSRLGTALCDLEAGHAGEHS